MPKATRAKDNQETPKKRSRTTQPVDGKGTNAAEPVTTAPAIAQATPEAKRPGTIAKPVNGSRPVSEELVRRRAYELYLQRRGQGGTAEQDWFQALQEISGQHVA
jgi:hypothetical protein